MVGGSDKANTLTTVLAHSANALTAVDRLYVYVLGTWDPMVSSQLSLLQVCMEDEWYTRLLLITLLIITLTSNTILLGILTITRGLQTINNHFVAHFVLTAVLGELFTDIITI